MDVSFYTNFTNSLTQQEAQINTLQQGNAQLSINILEPALTGRKADDKPTVASLHAYLGVAYATQALSAPEPADQTKLRDKALEHFRLAISAQRNYQLSGRLVSPKIVTQLGSPPKAAMFFFTQVSAATMSISP